MQIRLTRNILVLCFVLIVLTSSTAAQTSPCANGQESGLPLPSGFLPGKLPEFQAQLKTFLTSGKYKTLNWCEDKKFRDTGPFVNGVSYGVHPTVKIYYSPSVINWLLRKDPNQVIPDGAMIVKEQYTPPAARYQLAPPKGINGWTIMIKDSKGSQDGWYWAEIWDAQCLDNNNPPFAVPYAGFGLYCVRCHASAEKEHTFTYSKNIKGFPGDPDSYFVDLSWATAPVSSHAPAPAQPCGEAAESDRDVPTAGHNTDATDVQEQTLFRQMASLRPSTVNPAFVTFYKSITPVPLNKVQKFPGETYDHVYPRNTGSNQFLTSDQCMGCHSGGTYGNVMLYTGTKQPDGTTPVMNVSPFAEWRWSPMGLAGRDPVFYAQLDSEIEFVKSFFKDDPAKVAEKIKTINNTCFKCHGVMGKRRLDDDHGGPDKGNFERDLVYSTYDTNPPAGNKNAYIYGALARDGVSCMACHRIVEDKIPFIDFLKTKITGNFTTGNAAELFGPFEDKEIVTDPMNNSLGIKPKHDPYIKSSRMCGSCHTINLPVVDWKPPVRRGNDAEGQRPVTHSSLEQLTYLEWLNSGYQDEFGGGPKAQTCQDCHMRSSYRNSKGTLEVPLIQQPIAAVEDDRYPATEGLLPPKKTHVRLRESGYVRHQLQGLNVPLLEMFRQYMENGYANGYNLLSNPVLGVRQNDYMQSVADNLPNAIDAFVEQAADSTAEVSIAPIGLSFRKLTADVLVTNKTGHRFPSGVGFRRGFIELKVVDTTGGREQTIWCSGCTDSLGVITNGDGGPPLPSELFDKYQPRQKPERSDYPAQCQNVVQQQYQPHFWGARYPVTRQNQVQVFEELDLNADCVFTSSFIRRDFVVKDNRLLPLGWTERGPLGPDGRAVVPKEFLEPTHPEGVWDDPRYADGSGTSLVRYEVELPPGVNPNNLKVSATLY